MLRPVWRVPPGAMVGAAVTISAVRCGALTGPGPPSPMTGICAFADSVATDRVRRKAKALEIVGRVILDDCKVCIYLTSGRVGGFSGLVQKRLLRCTTMMQRSMTT